MTEPEQPVAVPLRAALERLAAKRVEYLNAEERDSAAKDWQMADRARYIAAGIDIAVADLWPLVDGAALAVEAVRPEDERFIWDAATEDDARRITAAYVAARSATSSASATAYLRDALQQWLRNGSSIEAADDLRTAAAEWLRDMWDAEL